MAEEINYEEKSRMVATVFTPNTPISEKDMFSGRILQIRKLIDVIFQKGQHAIVFGDRGVGKTSLANVLFSLVPPNPTSTLMSVKINCDTSDTFSTVWKKIFQEMQLVQPKAGMGFHATDTNAIIPVETFLPNKTVTPDDVKKALRLLSNFLPIIIVDEFDRLSEDVKRLFADLIKTLSDNAFPSTIILIGVGDSVDQLIKEHESIARAMAQVNMPRMNNTEIKEIISNGLQKLGMSIDPDTLQNIALLSKGLPHYAHLIGKHSAREALDNKSLLLTEGHFKTAIEKAITEAQHSIKTNYHSAIRSTKKVSLFSDVILACALAPVNELGEFAALDIKDWMQRICGKPYEISAYAKHLDEFSSVNRSNILIKSGVTKRFRYKFRDPLMQSYVIMQGLISGKITQL